MREIYKYSRYSRDYPLLRDGEDWNEIFDIEEVSLALETSKDNVVELWPPDPEVEEPDGIEDFIHPDILIKESEVIPETAKIKSYKTYYYLEYKGREIRVYTYYCHFMFVYMRKEDFDFIMS